MTEPTPPPAERPLPDETRARIRSELLAHAHDHRSNAPRWAVPIGAAAAVALVAGLGYWAVNTGSEPGRTPVGGGDGGPTSDPTVTLAPDPSVTTPDQATSAPADPATTVFVGTRSCEEEMEFVLRGAELAVAVDDASSFWVKGDRFVLCDQLGGRTTIHQALPLGPRDEVSTYAVSTVFEGKDVVRAAGGVVPAGAEGVFDVAYTFQDGHTEHATTSTDASGRTWWHVAYTYPYAGNELKQPPIEVTVSLSGVQRHYELRPALDTCAQANHGC